MFLLPFAVLEVAFAGHTFGARCRAPWGPADRRPALTSPFLVNGHSALLGVENRGMSIMTSTLSTSAGQNSGLGLKSDYDKEGSH